jgi:hypothetical protein
MAAPFGATWGTLIERCEDLPDEATLITPLASKRFRITDIQDQRIIIEDVDSGDSQPLQREQFEALAEHTRGKRRLRTRTPAAESRTVCSSACTPPTVRTRRT